MCHLLGYFMIQITITTSKDAISLSLCKILQKIRKLKATKQNLKQGRNKRGGGGVVVVCCSSKADEKPAQTTTTTTTNQINRSRREREKREKGERERKGTVHVTFCIRNVY
jgi:hypothetical protein